MAGSPTGICRNAVRVILADDAAGFNSRVQALFSEFGLKPYTVDFGSKSTTFFQGYIAVDTEDVNESQLSPEPLALCIYATSAVNAKTTNHRYFSGLIEIRIDAYVRLRAREETAGGIESDDTETPMDCVEQAITDALRDSEAWGEVNYNHDFKIDRSPLLFLPDGVQQRTSIQIACEVRI